MDSVLRRHHVAFLAFPFGTHAPPLYSLARALAAAAPNASFSFFSSAKSNSGLALSNASSKRGPPNLRTYDVSDGGPDGDLPLSPPEEVRYFLEVTPENFSGPIAAAEAALGKISCVVSDAFLWFAGDVAAEREADWVALWTGGPSSLAAHLHTDLLREKFSASDEGGEEELCDLIHGLESVRVGDLPEGIVHGDLKSAFARMLHRMAGELTRAAALVVNTFVGLDAALDSQFEDEFKRYLAVGPLSLLFPQPPGGDHHGCLEWLDRHAPASVVYVSFGTVIRPPPEELVQLAKGLEASGVPFLWSVKESAREHLPSAFLCHAARKGLLVPWAPQSKVLGHQAVGAFLTHCGWNSVLEGVSGGVPMICRPFFGDQRLNARVVSHVWKVGVELQGGAVTEQGMVRALNLILDSEQGKQMRMKVCELKELALQATKPSGSSTAHCNALVSIVIK